MSLPGTPQDNRETEQNATVVDEPIAEAVDADAADDYAAQPAAAKQAAGADVDGLSVELEDVKTELAELKDEYLRARAEAENVRRRSEQEVAKARKYAVENFALELLAVKDSLDLAADVELGERDDPVVANMHEGLALTRRQFDTVFEKFGIAVIDPTQGDKMNPDLHQAMSLQESGDVPPNHILQVIQKGFTLNDRLLRPAMVIVARAPAGGAR
ncbi:MAG: nucleotide exchange factor GrpE [Proteobacteria bacterium]|nr:MAG: nucleotide exchange factor GrpE [Pseudomonadota bacterium]